VVVAAQAFHWFEVGRALPEIARVLRPGGSLALVWNHRDERIPWVRRLGHLIGSAPGPAQMPDPTTTLVRSCLFGFVEATSFRFWQPLNRESLRDLVVSRSHVALMGPIERERVLRKVDELYDGYGRGADGMLLPYLTRCYRTVVLPQTDAPPARSQAAPRPGPDDVDTDALLIDFR
jgi:SAM-dependent methyltransferase